MRVAREDLSPPSLLGARPVRPLVVLGGLMGVLTAHLGVPLLLALLVLMFEAAGIVEPHRDVIERRLEQRRVVEVTETRFVKLGRILDPRQLPSKARPVRSSAPEQPSRTPHREARRVTPPDAAVAPRPLEDLLTRLGTRAEELARTDELPPQEGDPQGIEQGTERRDRGNVYAGILYAFFRRGWQVPTTIPEEALRELVCTVEVEITPEARVGATRVVAGSGNDEFDDSVRTRLAQAEGAQLPEPPEHEAERYLGATVRLRFLGRDAR
ncbi:MAG: TonB C-terminal domain-containing protein [Myxococcota bacterium]|nr:TonB C-terminal domain-containing protein [Myxococcota bacterium]MDW8362626.1 TonB C-terminal domain-containing protein [Myxococcales bacterium]